MPKFFTKYNPPKIPGFSSEMESKVQDQFADACQTDTIIRKYNMMGVNPFIAAGGSQYLDTTQIPDFVCAQNAQIKVKEYFEGLPSEVRLEFNNDPMQFAEVVSDPRNADYLREIGVLAPLPSEQEGEKQPASSGDIFEQAPRPSSGSELSPGFEAEKAENSEKSNA
ncbi:hypothetical protein E2488_15690 [Gramella jeungdoensis]|uniref:Internal scaffolding protein n=1 Tax=Gramella jeungdoensis TaxID=708091 RepID=A0A4Y8AMN6_9FLAO|nr:hypothetical protein [Gramella jeungdoensis]TEW71388.1 hypothetical protein E2488_15690 [Gramella jeungdoensis]